MLCAGCGAAAAGERGPGICGVRSVLLAAAAWCVRPRPLRGHGEICPLAGCGRGRVRRRGGGGTARSSTGQAPADPGVPRCDEATRRRGRRGGGPAARRVSEGANASGPGLRLCRGAASGKLLDGGGRDADGEPGRPHGGQPRGGEEALQGRGGADAARGRRPQSLQRPGHRGLRAINYYTIIVYYILLYHSCIILMTYYITLHYIILFMIFL